jgi:perosamine synthetase
MSLVPNPKVPWSGRGLDYTAEEIAVVVDAMKHADPMTQGRHQLEFQRAFSEKLGATHSFAVATATAALELSAMLCRLKPGDEVILPAHTFAATAIPFARTGAKLVWADIDPRTRVITAETIEPLITNRTRVVIVVHLYGLAAEMDPILALAKQHGLIIVEDAAQVVGGTYKGKALGTIGDFGCFSFHTHKNISTLGEGGMLVVKDAELAKLVPGLRHNGGRPFPPRKDYWIPAMSDVDFGWDGVWPYNFCIGEIQCALGTKLLARLDAINTQRRERALAIIQALKDYPELCFQTHEPHCEHVYHLLAPRIDVARHGKTRDDFIRMLGQQYGVESVVQYCPLYRYPMFQKAGFGEAHCPNSDDFFDNMASLPFTLGLSQNQLDYMVASVKKVVDCFRSTAA